MVGQRHLSNVKPKIFFNENLAENINWTQTLIIQFCAKSRVSSKDQRKKCLQLNARRFHSFNKLQKMEKARASLRIDFFSKTDRYICCEFSRKSHSRRVESIYFQNIIGELASDSKLFRFEIMFVVHCGFVSVSISISNQRTYVTNLLLESENIHRFFINQMDFTLLFFPCALQHLKIDTNINILSKYL